MGFNTVIYSSVLIIPKRKKKLGWDAFSLISLAKTHSLGLIGVGMPPDTTQRRIVFLKPMR